MSNRNEEQNNRMIEEMLAEQRRGEDLERVECSNYKIVESYA